MTIINLQCIIVLFSIGNPMRKVVFASLFLVCSAHATSQPTMLVFKCSPNHSQTSTIVTWQDVKKEDGWHRYASWKDKVGQHYGIELYFNGSVPNADGQIENINVFGNMDSQKKLSGPAISMIFNKKAKLITYKITNDSVGSDVRNPLEHGECVLSDKS